MMAEPQEWWLEISNSIKEQAWSRSQGLATAALPLSLLIYLNELCLNTVLPWLQEGSDTSITTILSQPNSIWALTSGTALEMGDKRLVLLPSEAMDGLEVPQEWVDIPSWLVDYYLAVQVNPDESWVRVWGFTTHAQVKQEGIYDPVARFYTLDQADLDTSLNSFEVTLETCGDAVTQAAIAPLPLLPDIQAQNLLQRLSNPNLAFPRLAIPFSLWGALLENPQWRDRLSQLRQNPAAEQSSATVRPLVNLSQWFQDVAEAGWRSLTDLAAAGQYEGAVAQRDGSAQNPDLVQRCKQVSLDIASGEAKQLRLCLELTPTDDNKVAVRVQLYPMPPDEYLPEGIAVTLLDDDASPLQSAQADVSDAYFIQLRTFRGTSGSQFSLSVTLAEASFIADFVV
ncbi:MAG: DUF1822 family protein [Cyanobacteria bacterium P01_F01_bin.150]